MRKPEVGSRKPEVAERALSGKASGQPFSPCHTGFSPLAARPPEVLHHNCPSCHERADGNCAAKLCTVNDLRQHTPFCTTGAKRRGGAKLLFVRETVGRNMNTKMQPGPGPSFRLSCQDGRRTARASPAVRVPDSILSHPERF
jgi:hypothetical protein